MKNNSNKSILDLIKGNKSVIIGSLFTGISAIFIFLIEPVKDSIYRIFFKEKGSVHIKVNNHKIYVGDTIVMDVEFRKKSSIPISPGTSEIIINREYMHIISDFNVFSYPKIENDILLFESRNIKIVGLKEGKTKINFKTYNKYLETSDETTIEILKDRNNNIPSASNFSGIWNITLGNYTGSLEIIDKRGRLSGNYILSSPNIGSESGVIGGIRDGSVFNIFLIRTGELVKWKILANWKPYPDFIEINGKAKLLNIVDGKWIESESLEHDFSSSVDIRR